MPAAPALPRWTWWLPLLLFPAATWLSMGLQFTDDAPLLYVPPALGLVLCLWWGPRVLPAMYLNCLLSVPLWGLDWWWAPLYALPEVLGLALAWWLLCRRPFDVALPDLSALLCYCGLGVLLPSMLMALGLQSGLWLTGYLAWEALPVGVLTQSLSGDLAALALATPLLVYATPYLRRRGWVRSAGQTTLVPALRQLPPWYLLAALLLGLPWVLGWLPLTLNLPLLGVVMLVLALVWGMAGALCGALLSVLMLLVLPLVVGASQAAEWLDPQRLEMHLSVLLFMLAALLIGRSLSDLRQALQHSAEVQQQLALANLALDASPLGVSIIDARSPTLPVIYSNPALARISGFAAEESLGSDSLIRLQDVRAQSQLPRLQHAILRGEACQVVLRNVRKDGTAFWNELILAPLRDALGVSHFVALHNDVSAREELAEQVARQRHELLRQSHLFSQTEHIASLGGWVLDVADSSMYWSQGCFRIYELDPNGAAPSLAQARDYLDANGRLLAQQVMQRLREGRDQFDIEVRLISARGRSRWVRVRGMAERDGQALVRVYGAVQDISARKRTEQQLRERDERLRLFFEAPLLGMALTTPSYGWEEVNAKLCSILGRSTEQLLGCSWADISQPDDWLLEQHLLDAVLSGAREGYELDKRFVRPDGTWVHTRTNLRAVRLASGRVSMFLLLVEDISARYEAEARYRTMIEHAPEAIMLFAPRGGVIDCNENALRLFRCSREDLLGKTVLELSPQRQADGQLSATLYGRYLRAASAGQAPVFEWLHRDSAGRQVSCEVRLVRLPGDEALIRCSITDISERQRYQREIERLAYSDELTGLPNRRLLLDRLQHAMDRELREGSLGALLFIDLDHFKTVNDSLGHLVGDGLLREVTVRLAGSLRAEDTLARMGGDEFVVLLEGLDGDPQVAAEHAALTAEKLLHSLEGSCWIDGHELSISASIGIALHPFGTQVAADVLKQADTAMYRAKHAGRNALHFFAPAMQAAIDQRLQLQGELRQAIQREQLYLMFQPQLTLDGGQVAGAEVLLRWLHPERGEIAPDQFIPLAEETGLIQDIGHWVLERACAALAGWLPEYPGLVLAVNLSPRELRQGDCVTRIQACLARYQLPHAALELEITEGVLLEDVEQCIANMSALRASGFRFAIDDFGTGYSSLTYLKRLPLDRLKIDRSFIQDLDGDSSDLMLVQTILMIACNLGLECVAEGIETAHQLEVLRAHGCELGQGFHLGVPMRAADFCAWLDARG